MTRAISTRIARLERKKGVNARPLPNFFVHFVGPGPVREAVRAGLPEQTWTRLPEETESAFEARITADLPPPSARTSAIVLLFQGEHLPCR